MAAPIQTLSDSLEGQVFELAQALQAAELNEPEDTRPNNVTLVLDTEGALASVTITMPITLRRGATGQIEIAANPYLPQA